MDNVYIKESNIAGKGLFAKRKINKGEVIGVVKGQIVPNNKDSCKKYGEDYLHPISHSKAILNNNFTKYINHSCNPNCGLKDGLIVVALKNIQKGKEITIDYDTLEYSWRMKCNCKSAKCRKIIKGYKYLSEKLKNKYKGFISPYLLEKPNC